MRQPGLGGGRGARVSRAFEDAESVVTAYIRQIILFVYTVVFGPRFLGIGSPSAQSGRRHTVDHTSLSTSHQLCKKDNRSGTVQRAAIVIFAERTRWDRLSNAK